MRRLLILTLMLGFLVSCAPMATPTTTPATPTAPAATPTVSAEEKPFLIGMVMVGPYNDHGWSQAHFDALNYVVSRVPGVLTTWIDLLVADVKPNITLEQVVDEMVAQGAKLIFTTSDYYVDDTTSVAEKYPDVIFMNISGDNVWKGDAPPNLGNIMGRMEYGKMIAGCTGAMTTKTGILGYLGPLVNDETRRLASSAYLGAKYCWTHYRGKDPNDLRFIVTWIGFWFKTPATLDPVQVVNDFFNEGADVVLSGIDTPEALTVTQQRSAEGDEVWAIPYDYKDACLVAPNICLGVPYFNWGPAYLATTQAVMNSTWTQSFDWNGPDWSDINNLDTSAVGFKFGPAVTPAVKAKVEEFIAGLASGEISLFEGPLNWQDGTVYLEDGQKATDREIWYFPKLLEGMEGPSE